MLARREGAAREPHYSKRVLKLIRLVLDVCGEQTLNWRSLVS